MPGLRHGQRRTLRHLGRSFGARAPASAKASSLIEAAVTPHIAAVVLRRDGGVSASGRHGKRAAKDVDTADRLREALGSQTRLPDTVIEISSPKYSGAQDLSRSTRSGLLTDRRKARRTRTTGPAGSKVTSLWRHLERQLPDGFTARHQWLWILPEDVVPAPDALEKLEERLFTVKDEETHSSIQVIGAKQLHQTSAPGSPQLIDVGLYPARSGEVLTTTEPRELDQGQYDGRDEVPAVSTAGMLVHAPLFGDLGGFDPQLPADYAAAQFCDRVRETGGRVVIEPAAAILRSSPPRREQVHRFGGSLWLPEEQRRGQILRRLSTAPGPALPFLWLGMWLAALFRVLALTAVKAPDAAVGQFVASIRALLNLAAVGQLRRFASLGRKAVLTRLARDGQIKDSKAVRKAGRQASRSMRLSPAAVREQRKEDLTSETVAAQRAGYGLAGDRRAEEDNYDALLSVGSADGGFDEMPARRSGDRLGLFLILIGLAGLSLLTFRSLLGAEAVVSPAALPVSPSTETIFAHTISFVAAEGLGERTAADPFNLVLLLLSAVSFGNASTVLVWTVILAMPLAALTAWWASGLWSSRAGTRIIAALLWAAVPALQVGLGEGRIGAVLVHILLPLVVLAAVRSLGPRETSGSGSWEHATGAALLLAVVTASAPVLLSLAVIVPVVAAIALGRRGRPLWLLPLPSLVLLAPLLASAFFSGSNIAAVLFSDPTRPMSAEAAPIWQQLLGFPREFDAAAGIAGNWAPSYFDGEFWSLRTALLIGVPLLLVALLGILTAGRRRRGAVAAGLVLLLALGVSALAAQLAVADEGERLIAADITPLVTVMAFCLLTAAMTSLDRLPQALPRLGGSITPVATTLLVLSVVASLATWAAPRSLPSSELTGEPLTAVNDEPTLISAGTIRQVPSTAADQGNGPSETRTLLLSASDRGVVAELISGSGKTLDSTSAVDIGGHVPLWARPGNIPEALGGTRGVDAAAEQFTPKNLSDGQQRLAELVASLVSPGSSGTGELMAELGVGYVLIEGNEPNALSEAVDTAEGLAAVGPTDRGLLWRAQIDEETDLPHGPGQTGTPTSWVRIIDSEANPVALLPSSGHSVDIDLSEIADSSGQALDLEIGEDYYLELSTERANGWRAELDGVELAAVSRDETPWMQRFELPDDPSGQLTVHHRSTFQMPVLIGVGAVLLLVLLIAVPVPRNLRMRPVRATPGHEVNES